MSEGIHKDDKGLLIIVKHILKWKIPIAIATGIAALASIIITMPAIWPPQYKSTIVFYPAASTSISKALLAKDLSGKQDALKFGEEEEAEQLLQILESDVITNRIIEKYNLMQRYRIEADDEYKNTTLTEKYYGNVKFKRNEHMAIEVSVYDESPDTAALIARDIANLMDSVKTEIIKQRAHEALAIVEAEYQKKQKEITLLEEQLATFGAKGIINYEEQAASLSEALDKAKADYYAALAKYSSSSKQVQFMKERLEEVQKDYNNLGKYGGAWLSVKEGLVLELEQFKLLKEKYEQAKVDVERKLTFKYVTNYPTPAEKKARPIRSVIVIVSTLAAFILSSLVFVLYEVYQKNKNWLVDNQ